VGAPSAGEEVSGWSATPGVAPGRDLPAALAETPIRSALALRPRRHNSSRRPGCSGV